MLKVNNPRMLKMNGLFADFETSTQFELEIYRVTVNFQITVNLFKIFVSIFVFNVCVSKISVFIPKNSKQNTEQNRTRKFGFATEQNRTEHGLKIFHRTQNRTEREKLCVLSPLVHRDWENLPLLVRNMLYLNLLV